MFDSIMHIIASTHVHDRARSRSIAASYLLFHLAYIMGFVKYHVRLREGQWMVRDREGEHMPLEHAWWGVKVPAMPVTVARSTGREGLAHQR